MRDSMHVPSILLTIAACACASSDKVDGPHPRAGPGRVMVRAVTSGEDPDVAYIVRVDGGLYHLLLADNGTVIIDSVAAGNRVLHIAGVAPNCVLSGSNARSLTIVSDSMLTETVDVSCAAVTRRILFGSNRDGNYDLYAMDADGGNVVRLTTDTAYHGRWSPDGAQLAYHSPRSGHEQIYVADADGRSPRPLTSGDGDHEFPRWSPDGSQISYTVDGAVWVMGADGTGQHQVGEGIYAIEGASWSPDGTSLLFDRNDASQTGQVFVVNADGSNQQQLTFGLGYYSVSATWSPDGRRLGFVADRDFAFTNILTMDADGSHILGLTDSPGGVANSEMAWSPDGGRITFSTNRDGGNPEIYLMGADGSDPLNLSQNSWDDYGASWHP